MRQFLFVIILTTLITNVSLNAQNRIVQYDYRNNTFNEGNPLPVGEEMIFTGTIPTQTVGVQLQFFPRKGEDYSDAFYTGYWRVPYGENAKSFRIPMTRKLRPTKRYDARISYFREMTDKERAGLKKDIMTSLNAYIDQSFDVNKKKLKFVKHTKDVKADLDIIMRNALGLYMSKRDYSFKGFSDLTLKKIKDLESASLRTGMEIFKSKTKKELKAERFEDLANDLKEQVRIEVESVLNMGWIVSYDSRYVDDYATESSSFGLPIQVGYGVAYMDGVVDSLNYGHGPQLGLSIPLGREAYANKFFSNATLDIGVFLRDFKDGKGNKVTGPVIRKPIYVGLGYNVYKFININGGVTLLEDGSTAGTIDGVGQRVYVRPFIGLNAKFNISMGK